MLNELIKEIESHTKISDGKNESRYSKTGPGDYAEGQKFLGIKTKIKREIAKKYYSLSLSEVLRLMEKNIHDLRFIGLLILVGKYKKQNDKEEIVNFYLKNTKKINNWSLVDISAYNILGDFLKDKNKKILYDLARSKNLWEKRIAIVSTYPFIRNGNFSDTLKISEILLDDSHDLIHKAVGWMLREVGKKDARVLKDFLKINYKKIPRTTLRYAIEKFPEGERRKWLQGELK